jgi:hypothetical protein
MRGSLSGWGAKVLSKNLGMILVYLQHSVQTWQAGFGKIYAYLDLIEAGSNPLKKYLFQKAKHSVWLRAILLTQLGGSIFMIKRPH